MNARWQGICLWAVVLTMLSGWCHAQSVTPDQEYEKLIQVQTTLQPLGEHPFGEQVDLNSGSLSFEETDVSLPGNGPTLRLGRTLTPGDASTDVANVQRAFGDWNLDIPRIETYTADNANDTGWQTAESATLRCTDFDSPPTVNPTQTGADPWSPNQWWYGYHLMVPGEGSQTLLDAGTPGAFAPTISGMSFPIDTKQGWVIGCGVTASDGGEGFLAVAPDGTRYTFAHLVYQPMAGLTSPLGTPPGGDAVNGIRPLNAPYNFLGRRDALMYVTKIQDRYGNTLTYNYSGNNLVGIVASDGRQVTLSYVAGTSLVHTVTVQSSNVAARTWTYSYDTTTNSTKPILTGVQLPDSSTWSYQLSAFQAALILTDGGDCQTNTLPVLESTTVTGSITQPSGLKATFTLTPMLHGRSYVPRACMGDAGTNGEAIYAEIPEYFYQYSLTSEVLSGSGLPTESWTYSYSPVNESWTTDSCANNNSCPSTVYVDVTDPGGSDTRYTFSNRFDATEGLLLRTDYYSGAAGSMLMRSVINVYANPTGGPWPVGYGYDLQSRDNTKQTVELSPLSERTITQGGQNYIWQAMAFNAYAQPIDVKRSNDIAGQTPVEETTDYLNDTNHWVLGLPQTVTNISTPGQPETESSNTYNSLDELTARTRFGQTLMHYTWNSAGQLASFTDGDNHTTTLGSYVRGIPTAIGYPDGTSESLAVDDLGQITAITDQLGNTTNYSYDAIGRIAKITYPYDSSTDSASWYPKTFSYSYVTGAERGLAAGHWRRTITQGAATDTTWFDAELRPVLDDTSDGNEDISTATGYDWRGLTAFASYPVSGSPSLSSVTTGTHSAYDALGRLTQTQQDSELGTLTTTTAYLSGARKQVTDPKGNVTTTTYQVFDQPTYDTVLEVQAPTGITQTTTRDVYGNPLSITQSGSYGTESDSVTKSLYYDSSHRLCRTTEPETGSTVMAYDDANNLAWSADGLSITGTGCGQDQVATAAKTTRTYDAMNRMLTIQPPSGTQSTTYTYDAIGHLASTLSGISYWWADYDTQGHLSREALWLSGQAAWGFGYLYTPYGDLAALIYPNNEVVDYAPDAWGRPTRVNNYATGVSHYPDDQLEGFTFPSGTSYLADENARHLTSNFTYGKGSALAVSEDQTYDKDGNLTTVDDLVDGMRNKSFGYDALNRLTSATAPNLYGTENYAYDALNNLRQEVTGGIQFNLNPDADNRLASMTIGSNPFATYQNDAAGNRTATVFQGTVNYTWDARHQLLGMSRDGTNVVGYAYDAQGRRVEKIPADGSAPIYYFYNHAGQLIYQYDPVTATATNYVYLGTKLIGDSTTTSPTGGTSVRAVHSYYTDPQGSVLAKTDAQGNILSRYDYQPYGSVTSGAGPNGPGYTGHVNDPETGLIYMQQRYDTPSEGRFMSPDPVGVSPGDVYSFNRYVYADNNPIIKTDPTGEFPGDMSGDQRECEVYHCGIQGDDQAGRSQRAVSAMHRANDALQKAGVTGHGYKKINDLAVDWSAVVSPITTQMQVEIGSDIYLKESGYFSSLAYSTGDRSMINFTQITTSIPSGGMLVAEIHAHPINVGFSGGRDWATSSTSPVRGYGDLGRYYGEQIDGYVALPNGEIEGWSYKRMINEFNDDGKWHYLKDATFWVR